MSGRLQEVRRGKHLYTGTKCGMNPPMNHYLQIVPNLGEVYTRRRLAGGSQAARRRLAGGSQAARRRLAGGSQAARRRLAGGSQAARKAGTTKLKLISLLIRRTLRGTFR